MSHPKKAKNGWLAPREGGYTSRGSSQQKPPIPNGVGAASMAGGGRMSGICNAGCDWVTKYCDENHVPNSHVGDSESLALIIQEHLGWDWEASPAEFVPSGLECCREIADAVEAAGWRLNMNSTAGVNGGEVAQTCGADDAPDEPKGNDAVTDAAPAPAVATPHEIRVTKAHVAAARLKADRATGAGEAIPDAVNAIANATRGGYPAGRAVSGRTIPHFPERGA